MRFTHTGPAPAHRNDWQTIRALLPFLWQSKLRVLLALGCLIAAKVASVVLLGWAMRTLPVGTAYAVWTGIGALGTVVLGIVLFGEPATVARLACMGLILAGIVGLKLTHG